MLSPPDRKHSDQNGLDEGIRNNGSRANGKEPMEETGDHRHQGVSGDSSPPPATGKIVTPNLKMFTLDELKSATRNFRPDTVLGEGGFGRVFKGWVEEKTFKPSKVGVGIPIAVKKSNPDSLQGMLEWQVNQYIFLFSSLTILLLIATCRTPWYITFHS